MPPHPSVVVQMPLDPAVLPKVSRACVINAAGFVMSFQARSRPKTNHSLG